MRWLLLVLLAANIGAYLVSVAIGSGDSELVADSHPVNEKSMVLLSELDRASAGNAGTAGQCLRIGPFASDTAVAEAVKIAVALGVAVGQRTISARPLQVFRVYLGPFQGAADLNPLARRLETLHIDNYQVQAADGRALLSLGLFASQPAADEFAANMDAVGLKSRIRTESRSLGPFQWILVQPANAGQRQRLTGIDWPGRGGATRPAPCDGFAGR